MGKASGRAAVGRTLRPKIGVFRASLLIAAGALVDRHALATALPSIPVCPALGGPAATVDLAQAATTQLRAHAGDSADQKAAFTSVGAVTQRALTLLQQQVHGDSRQAGASAANLLELDSEIASYLGDTPSVAGQDLRIRSRMSLVTLYVGAGCKKEAAVLLRDTLPLTNFSIELKAAVEVDLGASLTMLGDFSNANRVLTQSIQDAGGLHTVTGILTRVSAVNSLGVIARRRGEYALAESEYQKLLPELVASQTLEIFRNEGDTDRYARTLSQVSLNLGMLYAYEQKTSLAKPLFDRAIEQLRHVAAVDARVNLAEALRSRSDLYNDMGQSSLAAADLDEAINIARQLPPKAPMLADLLRRRIELSTISAGQTASDLKEMRSILQSAGDADDLIAARGFELEGKLQTDQPAAAAVAYHRAADLYNRALPDGSLDTANALTLASMAEASGKDMTTAARDARAANVILDRWLGDEMRGCSAGRSPNEAIVSLQREWLATITFQDPARTPGRLSQTDADVFSVVQSRERDRTGVAAMRSALRERPQNSESVRAYETALERLCNLGTQFEKAVHDSSLDQATSTSRALAQARADVQSAQQKFSDNDRIWLVTGRHQLTIQDATKLLRDREALLVFRTGSASVVTSLIARGTDGTALVISLISYRVHPVDLASAVAGVINNTSDPTAFDSAMAQLDSLLKLAPMAGALENVEHIFVVPDGALSKLPVHLIPINGKPLLQYAATSTLPTIGTFTAVRAIARTSGRSNSLLAIGAPTLNPLPCSDPLGELPPKILHRDVLCLGDPPGLSQLATGLRDDFGGPSPLLRGDATLSKVLKADYTSAGIVLFATHALTPPDSGFPDLHEAAIVLTPSSTDPADNGLLLAHQIARLNLDSVWLSIIAACDSGASAQGDTEGFTGLAYAFITAGSRSLIVSHWYVDPEYTRQLLDRMAALMKAQPDLNVTAALRSSMLLLRDAKMPPHDWAPFVVVGDGALSLQRH